MYQIDFNKTGHVHFTGIGGISMSALAEILLSRGFTVSGSDSHESDLTKHLVSLGADIVYEQKKENITPDIDLLVYTAAVKQDNPELVEALELSVPMLSRAELLGQIMKNYSTAICVSGTHGKTTTTSMISQILLEEECDPTILVGGIFSSINGNARIGHSSNFITEACEYTNSFLSFFPSIAVILNVREDHMDFFKDINDIRNSFKKFASLVPPKGAIIINSDIENYEYFTEGLSCKIITFGTDEKKSNYSAANITYNKLACASYDLVVNGEIKAHIELKVPGEHNIINSLSAIATCQNIGIDYPVIVEGLKKYCGTDRRFQYKGTVNGVTIVDDYAHHPDEISVTLKTAANYPHNNVWCVFQPHTFSRTKTFMKEFAQSLSLADKVILADIYPARETDNLGISSQNLYDEIKSLGTEVYYLHSFEEIKEFVLKNCINDDLLITMGAGDIVNVGNELVK